MPKDSRLEYLLIKYLSKNDNNKPKLLHTDNGIPNLIHLFINDFFIFIWELKKKISFFFVSNKEGIRKDKPVVKINILKSKIKYKERNKGIKKNNRACNVVNLMIFLGFRFDWYIVFKTVKKPIHIVAKDVIANAVEALVP